MANQDDDNQNQGGGQGAFGVFERHHGKLFVGALVVSLLVHVFSFVELDRRAAHAPPAAMPRSPVKIRLVQKPKSPAPAKPKADDETMPKILETPQSKTERPVEASHVGTVDHRALKETRVSEKVPRDKAKDPGQKGKPDAQQSPPRPKVAAKPQPAPGQTNPKQNQIKITDQNGTVSAAKPRNPYEALLPTNPTDLPGQVNAGFQDYVDDKVQEGDRIDINTTEYRYIGYFTAMRKAIELVWNYPTEASRKGLQGEVALEFAINRDGKATHIRVLKSSGYEVLDRAIVEAIKLASPFSPLPSGFGRNRLVVTGSFRYILSAYGAH